jgi:hypothetical protein
MTAAFIMAMASSYNLYASFNRDHTIAAVLGSRPGWVVVEIFNFMQWRLNLSAA